MKPNLIEDSLLVDEIDRLFNLDYDDQDGSENVEVEADFAITDPRTINPANSLLDPISQQRARARSGRR